MEEGIGLETANSIVLNAIKVSKKRKLSEITSEEYDFPTEFLSEMTTQWRTFNEKRKILQIVANKDKNSGT